MTLRIACAHIVLGSQPRRSVRRATLSRCWNAGGAVWRCDVHARDNRVIELDSHRPHRAGVCVCSECGYQQVSVVLADFSGPLECGRCGKMASGYRES